MKTVAGRAGTAKVVDGSRGERPREHRSASDKDYKKSRTPRVVAPEAPRRSQGEHAVVDGRCRRLALGRRDRSVQMDEQVLITRYPVTTPRTSRCVWTRRRQALD